MHHWKSSSLSAVVLAGGQSSRMGRDKAWLKVEGHSLLVRAVQTIESLGVEEIFISGRADVDYSVASRPVLLDLKPGSGPLGGIERALASIRSSLLLVVAVDLPHMSVAFLQKLIAGCEANMGVVPGCQGRLEPLVAIYPKRCHSIAASLLEESRYAAREFAQRCLNDHAVKLFEVAESDQRCFTNWNSPGDLAV